MCRVCDGSSIKPNNNTQTPTYRELKRLIRLGQLETLEQRCRHVSYPSTLESRLQSIIHFAIQHNQWSIVKWILKRTDVFNIGHLVDNISKDIVTHSRLDVLDVDELHHYDKYIPWYNIQCHATMQSNVSVLSWLNSHHYYSQHYATYGLNSPNLSVDMLQWMHDNQLFELYSLRYAKITKSIVNWVQCHYSKFFAKDLPYLEAMVKTCNVEDVIWVIDRMDKSVNIPYPEYLTYAACYGNLPIMNWLHDRGCEFALLMFESVLNNGSLAQDKHIEILNWLRAKKCPFDLGRSIMFPTQPFVVRWIQDNRLTDDKCLLVKLLAMTFDDVNVLRPMIQQYPNTVTYDVYKRYVTIGKLNVLEMFREYGIFYPSVFKTDLPWTYLLNRSEWNANFLEVVYTTHKVFIDGDTFDPASLNICCTGLNSSRILLNTIRWLRDHQFPKVNHHYVPIVAHSEAWLNRWDLLYTRIELQCILHTHNLTMLKYLQTVKHSPLTPKSKRILKFWERWIGHRIKWLPCDLSQLIWRYV